MNIELAEMAARLQENQERLERAEARLNQAVRRARLCGTLGLAAIIGAGLVTVRPAAFAQTPGVTLASLQAAITALQTKTAPLTTTGDATNGYQVTFTKANVQIVNGLGSTETKNGLGNLIVGYNEGTYTRTGSHNIISGIFHSYTSFGGIIGGYGNSLGGPEEFVVGALNTATGNQSSITGGISNTVSASYATILGSSSLTTSTERAIEPLSTLQTTVTNIQTGLGTLPTSGTSLVARLGSVETKTSSMSVSSDPSAGGTNTRLTFSGVNLQIVNGLGATNGDSANPVDLSKSNVNGLGNLIIGYNESRSSYGLAALGTDVRTGSHNLILGDSNNYSSYGGIAAGRFSVISAPYACVTGGIANNATGLGSSVSGGGFNTASGLAGSVSGGGSNTASGRSTSVGGGGSVIQLDSNNVTLSGSGFGNTASGDSGSVSGGRNITLSRSYTWAAGTLSSP